MSNVLTHRFVSPKLDGADLTQVQPSAWNDGHRFVGGGAGDVLTRDPSDATFGAGWVAPVGWVAYAPTWYVNGTLITDHADHGISGFYHQRGNAVWFFVGFSVGAAALPFGGGGYWFLGLPVACPPTTLSPGTGMLRRAATNEGYPIWMNSWTSTNLFVPQYLASVGPLQNFSGTTPVALAAGDVLELRGNYLAS